MKCLVKITSFHEKASKIGPCNCKIWLDLKSLDIAIVCLHEGAVKTNNLKGRYVVLKINKQFVHRREYPCLFSSNPITNETIKSHIATDRKKITITVIDDDDDSNIKIL